MRVFAYCKEPLSGSFTKLKFPHLVDARWGSFIDGLFLVFPTRSLLDGVASVAIER